MLIQYENFLSEDTNVDLDMDFEKDADTDMFWKSE